MTDRNIMHTDMIGEECKKVTPRKSTGPYLIIAFLLYSNLVSWGELDGRGSL